MYKDMDFEELGTLCSDEKLTNEKLTEIYNEIEDEQGTSKYSYVAAIIAGHKNAGIDLLERIYAVKDPLVLAALLNNPRTPKHWQTEGGQPITQFRGKLKEANSILTDEKEDKKNGFLKRTIWRRG